MRRTAGVAVLALVASCAGHARAPTAAWVGATAPAPTPRDGLLRATGEAVWRGDLAAAEVALTDLADRERGRPDPALDFWSELLALLRCEPLARVPHVTHRDPALVNPWDRLRRLVQIERVRLGREMPDGNRTPRVLTRFDAQATWAEHREVSWPIERENWSDELSVPVLVTRCALGDPPPASNTATLATDAEVALVARTAETLPLEHPAARPLLLQAAVLEAAQGRDMAATAALARAGVADPIGAAAGLDSRERDRATFAAALAASADPAVTAEQIVARGRAAMRLYLPSEVRRALSLVIAERLIAIGRVDDATAILGPPPHGDDAIGRYIAFLQAQAHARAGRRAELLAEARELLHRHRHTEVDADPALGAVMDMALRTLRASPISPETMEVLEALGPPRERLARADAFAETALVDGAPLQAMTTFAWLYDNDTDPERQLQHLARACVAAARAGSRADFARTFQLLAGQEERELSDKPRVPPRAGQIVAPPAPPPVTARRRDGALIASAEAEDHRGRKREARSVDWQRALLVVARDALTALVDNDDQADLATLVATLKRHLDDAGRGPVDEELTTLYRAASAHLKTGPRAYAETVGSERRPILLGDILIGRTYDVQPPAVDLRPALQEADPLVFVPRRGDDPTALASLQRWPGDLRVAWPGEKP